MLNKATVHCLIYDYMCPVFICCVQRKNKLFSVVLSSLEYYQGTYQQQQYTIYTMYIHL